MVLYVMEQDNCVELYHKISSQIQKESDDYFACLISAIAGNTDQKESGTWQLHEMRMIALRSAKVACFFKMLPSVKSKAESDVRGDFHKLLESIIHVKLRDKIDDEAVSDTLDCICAIAGSDIRACIINRLIPGYENVLSINKEFSEALPLLLTGISDYYSDRGEKAIAAQVLRYLIDMSRKRNLNAIDRHREIVIKVLLELGDNCPEERYQICKTEQEFFKGYQDEQTAEFLWIFGCVLQSKEKIVAARNRFLSCYRIRKGLYGEESWYTALARSSYSILTLLSENNEKKDSYNFLLRFINIIEEGGYGEMDGNTVAVMEGRILYSILLYKLNNNDFYSYRHYLTIFNRICERYNGMVSEPLIKLRLKSNLLGNYYFRTGDFIQAEQAFLDAVHAYFPDGTYELLSEAQVKSNLLMVYYIENDLEHAIPLLLELLDLIETEEAGLNRQEEYRILILNNSLISQSFMELDNEDEESLKAELDVLYSEVCSGDLLKESYASEAVVFIITSVQLLLQYNLVTDAFCNQYFDLLVMIKNNAGIDLNEGQKVILCVVLSVLAWELNDVTASDYIQEAVKIAENAVIPMSVRATVLQTAAGILSRQGKTNIALIYLKRSLRQITDICHSYMRYFNDRRLLQILSPIQFIFSCCYAIMRQQENDIWALYEKVLQYKALASFAGKERNRLLNAGLLDKGLVTRIKVVQDRLAVIESENIFLTASDAYEKERGYLRNLEASFSERFPDRIDFTRIEIHKIVDKLPDNCAIVEYYLSTKQYGRHQNEDDPDALVYDVFILKKTERNCSLQKVVIPYAEAIVSEAVEFSGILQNESRQKATVNQLEKKEILRVSLYKSLFEPIRGFLSGIRKIFIAPDGDIINLPFDILSGENGELLGDSFNIVKMECARDFLFAVKDSACGTGSLIIGNPRFQVRKEAFNPKMEKDSPDRTRFAQLKAEHIKPLPFSELEVQMVGKYCGSVYLTGEAADRKQLLYGNSKRNIHLATHGYYDLSEETDSIYSACLLFAGVKNWLQIHDIDDKFGNGIVTADEISRLDFHRVELVVLSSCMGGINEAVASKGFQGLVGGFSAAGVRYVISNLWNTDDLGTAILMDAFYYQYRIKKSAPPVALKKAQQYLRKVTVGELKKRKWFEYMLQSNVPDAEAKNQIRIYMLKNERFRPFKNEIYWAGFTCFRCN